jgi:hypothetical protein
MPQPGKGQKYRGSPVAGGPTSPPSSSEEAPLSCFVGPGFNSTSPQVGRLSPLPDRARGAAGKSSPAALWPGHRPALRKRSEGLAGGARGASGPQLGGPRRKLGAPPKTLGLDGWRAGFNVPHPLGARVPPGQEGSPGRAGKCRFSIGPGRPAGRVPPSPCGVGPDIHCHSAGDLGGAQVLAPGAGRGCPKVHSTPKCSAAQLSARGAVPGGPHGIFSPRRPRPGVVPQAQGGFGICVGATNALLLGWRGTSRPKILEELRMGGARHVTSGKGTRNVASGMSPRGGARHATSGHGTRNVTSGISPRGEQRWFERIERQRCSDLKWAIPWLSAASWANS